MRFVRRSLKGEGGSIFRVGVVHHKSPHPRIRVSRIRVPPRQGEAEPWILSARQFAPCENQTEGG